MILVNTNLNTRRLDFGILCIKGLKVVPDYLSHTFTEDMWVLTTGTATAEMSDFNRLFLTVYKLNVLTVFTQVLHLYQKTGRT